MVCAQESSEGRGLATERHAQSVGQSPESSPGSLQDGAPWRPRYTFTNIIGCSPAFVQLRELVHVMERVLGEHEKPAIEPGDLPATMVAEAERHMVERAVRCMQGNRTRAAQLMGLLRTCFYRKLKIYGLLPRDSVQTLLESGTQAHSGPQYASGSSYHAG